MLKSPSAVGHPPSSVNPMFIPPQKLKNAFEKKQNHEGKVQLQSSHLFIDSELASNVFGTAKNVYVVYYPNRKTLMLAPTSDELFKKLHKAEQQMLKDKNLKGDKTIALHEILIDNQLDETNRVLEYDLQVQLWVLSVKF